MIDYPDYKLATNAAYYVLQDYEGKLPEIDVFYILSKFKNIKLCSYSNAAKKMGVTHNEFTYEYASSEHGFTVADYNNNRYIIYYNDWKDETTIKFTLAHELGHIILQHKKDNQIAKKEADCFARNLIYPIPVSDGLSLKSVSDYAKCFHISEPMAIACIGNRKSDQHYITKNNYDLFDEKVYCYMSGCTPAELFGYV